MPRTFREFHRDLSDDGWKAADIHAAWLALPGDMEADPPLKRHWVSDGRVVPGPVAPNSVILLGTGLAIAAINLQGCVGVAGLDPEQAGWLVGLGFLAYVSQKVKEVIDRSFEQVMEVTDSVTAHVLEVQQATGEAVTKTSRNLVYALGIMMFVLITGYIWVHSHLMWKTLMRKKLL